MSTATKDISVTKLRENEKKWGKEMLEAGWTLVPNVLLKKQHALGLDAVDINILLQILKHWWRADEAPFPSQKTLAKLMDVDVSTVKRHLRTLRELGFIDWTKHKTKHGGNAANRYDFKGLIDKAHPFAVEENAARRKAAEERKAKKHSKRPDLRLVGNEDDDG